MADRKIRRHSGSGRRRSLAAAVGALFAQAPGACAQAPETATAFEVVADLDAGRRILEPSGIVFHPGRATLFVVGDRGDVAELTVSGELVAQRRVRRADFEGITVDPSTGLLYVAWEGEERVLEIDPGTLEVLREFALERVFEGRLLMRPGGDGIEGIGFVPDPDHPQGGTFFVAHQTFDPSDPEEASVLLEVELPLREAAGTDGVARARTLRVIPFGQVPDLASVEYDPAGDRLLVVSDALSTLFLLDRTGEVLGSEPIPGRDQEGIAVDGEGYWYIAQDSGGVLMLRRPEAAS